MLEPGRVKNGSKKIDRPAHIIQTLHPNKMNIKCNVLYNLKGLVIEKKIVNHAYDTFLLVTPV